MKQKPLQVLLVEDNPGDARLYQELLHESGPVQFELEHVKLLKTCLEHLARKKPDAILVDLGLPDSQGLETLNKVLAKAPQVPIVVLTGLDDAAQAVEAVREGAQDYLVKGDVDGTMLVRSLRYAIERKQAEQALRDSEERWHSLVTSTPDYIALHDSEGRYLFLSHYAEGFTEADVIGSSLYQYLLPESVELFRSNMEKAINTWTTQHFEQNAMGDKGARRTYDEYLVPLRGKNQEINILSVARDISERKLMEAALIQSEEKFRQLIENSVAGIYIIQDAKMAYVNPSFAKAFGYSPEEIIGRLSPKDLIHPDDIQAVMRRLQERMDGETEKGSIDYKAIKKDGSIIYIEVYGVTIDFQGRPAVMGTMLDVTERKRAEEILRESDSRYHLIFENSGTANTIFDKECRVILQNSMSQQLTMPMDAQGKTALEIFGPEQGPVVTERMQRVLNSGVSEIFETKFTMPGGTKWMRSSYFPLYKEKHELVGIQVISQDITEQKQAEEMLRESEIRYRSLIDNATIGIYRTTPEGHITMANPTLVRMLGFQSFDELAQRDLNQEGYEPGYPRKDFQKRIEQEGKVLGIESAWKRKDGTTIFLRESAHLVQDENNQPLFYEGTVEDITERTLMEDKLDEERILLRTLIDNLPDRVYVMDVEGRKTLSNVADWQASGGETMEDVIGKTDLETYPPELAKQYWALDKAVIDSGIPVLNREEPGLDAQGNPVWVLSSKVPFHDSRGKIMGLVGIGRDITGRKQTEILQEAVYKIAAAAETTESLDELYPQIHQIISSVMPAENFFITLYDEAQDLLRFPYFKDVADEPFMGGVQPGKGLTAYVLRTGKSLLGTQEVHDELERQGEVILLGVPCAIWLGVPLIVEGKTIGAMVVQHYSDPKAYGEREQHMLEFVSTQVAIAINRKRAEEKLRESEKKWHDLFEILPVGVSIVDSSNQVTETNSSLAQILELSKEELLKGKFKERKYFRADKTLMPLEEFPSTRAVKEQRIIREVEIGIEKEDGSIIWTNVSATPLSSNSAATVTTDITEHKQVEERIRQLNADLEKRVEERTRELREAQEQLVRKEKLAVLGQLAGGVGHELRNPLSVISTSIYYLKLVQPEADEKIKQHQAMIEQEVHNADKIITDLLDFARVVSAEKKPVSIAELVQKVLTRFPAPASVKVALDLPADLPQILADGRQMEQVLGNLVVNACQAMVSHTGTLLRSSATGEPEGGRLTISARRKQGMVAIAVKDTGTGIAPENMKKLFEPLFTTKAKGIGLGLAVSKKLAEANGGRIEVESEPGKGTTFTLWLHVIAPA